MVYFYGVEDWNFKRFQSYLSHRNKVIEYVNFKTDILEFECGVPQDVILGALLFLVNVIDLNKACHLLSLSC